MSTNCLNGEPDEDGGGGVDEAADAGSGGRVVVAARCVARTRTLGWKRTDSIKLLCVKIQV